ncbi:hypothetical protein ACV4QK_10295 [Alteromonas macleodii]
MPIPNSAIYDSNNRIQQEGGPYADALEISLPTAQSEREAILNIANQEATNQGMAFNPESDVINNKLLLWWD